MVSRYSVINLFLALWLGFVSQASIAQNHNVQSKKLITIAVQSFLGLSEANKKWYPTIDFLNKKFDKFILASKICFARQPLNLQSNSCRAL